MKPPDETLSPEHIFGAVGHFLKAQTFLRGAKYEEFVNVMVAAMNMITHRIVLRRGSRKGIVDSRVDNYLTLVGWETDFVDGDDDDAEADVDDFDDADLMI